MEILGYSERGMINSLFYEIFYRDDRNGLMQKLLSTIQFKNDDIKLLVSDSKIYIEQSLSDFGDSDAILLIDGISNKYTVFIEAKVKTSQRKSWSMEEVVRKFEQGLEHEVDSSNLITQLVYKSWLVKALRDNNWKDIMKNGIDSPIATSKKLRKSGDNKVVARVIATIKEYTSSVYYVALAPNLNNSHMFFNQLAEYINDINDHVGIISWENIQNFCINNTLNNTKKNFDFNLNQIY